MVLESGQKRSRIGRYHVEVAGVDVVLDVAGSRILLPETGRDYLLVHALGNHTRGIEVLDEAESVDFGEVDERGGVEHPHS